MHLFDGWFVSITMNLLMIQRMLAIDPVRLVVTTNVDLQSNKTIYESLRLLQSLRLFGGLLSNARVMVALSSGGRQNKDEISPTFLRHLLADYANLNVTTTYYRKSLPLPRFAPSLNKLNCFNPPGLHDDDLMIYLDADIFIADDPVRVIDNLLQESNYSDILCARPWDTFPGIKDFPHFAGDPDSLLFVEKEMNLIQTLSGGYTYNGMCNTGMYIMKGSVAKLLHKSALSYLSRAQMKWHPTIEPHHVPFTTTYFGIDSIVMWAAQHELKLRVFAIPSTLNWIAAAEDLLLPQCIDELSLEECIPVFIHFSKGSKLSFIRENLYPPRTDNPGSDSLHVDRIENNRNLTSQDFAAVSVNSALDARGDLTVTGSGLGSEISAYRCFLHVRGQFADPSPLGTKLLSILDGPACSVFYELLERYSYP